MGKFEKIINIVGMLLILVTIVTFNLIIGGNEKALPILPIGILVGLSFLVLLIKKIKYKEKIIKSKIDIAISAFMATLLLPLIFCTYCTYQGTIEFIIKYFFVYEIYLLARNVVDTKKKINVIIATTVFSSLIIIILGLDIQNGNNFGWLIKKLNLDYSRSYRFASTLGYSNAVAIYLTFCVFLAINRIENTPKKIVKAIYIIYIVLSTYIIYITYSRFASIIYVIALLGYLGVKAYKKVKKRKINILYIVIPALIIFMTIVTYIVVGMTYSKPFEVNDTLKFRKNFKPNQTYKLTFDIDVFNNKDEKTAAQVNIYEVNKYFNVTEIATKSIKPSELTQVDIKPSDDVYYITVKITHPGKRKVIMNKCYIDNKEYIFSYKYMPSIISRLITSFAIVDDSVTQRIQFYENCIRIAKDSPIIGHGGNTWKRLALAYEDYPYAVKETHSYFFELLISYGIVGLAAFIVVIVLVVKYCIKEFKENFEKRKQKLSIFIGLMLFIMYSIVFDLTMSFILTMLMVYIYIALLQFENKEKLKVKYIDWGAFAAIAIVFVALVRWNVAEYIIQDRETKVKVAPYDVNYRKEYIRNQCKDNLEEIKEIMLKEPYLAQVYNYKLYWDAIYTNAEALSEEKLINYIDFGIERFKKVKPISPMYFITILDRAEVMTRAIENLQKIENVDLEGKIKEIKDIMRKEYDENKLNITDMKRNHRNIPESEGLIKSYQEILKLVDIKID